jgi:hypothetical protein
LKADVDRAADFVFVMLAGIAAIGVLCGIGIGWFIWA